MARRCITGILLGGFCGVLALGPGTLEAQDMDLERRVAAFARVAEYADSVVSWNAGGVAYSAREIRVWSRREQLRPVIRQVAEQVGMKGGAIHSGTR